MQASATNLYGGGFARVMVTDAVLAELLQA